MLIFGDLDRGPWSRPWPETLGVDLGRWTTNLRTDLPSHPLLRLFACFVQMLTLSQTASETASKISTAQGNVSSILHSPNDEHRQTSQAEQLVLQQLPLIISDLTSSLSSTLAGWKPMLTCS